MELAPFRIAVPDEDLDDLRRRLARTRWPTELEDEPGLGVDGATVRRVVAHWRDGFDWRATEARLNRLDHRRVTVDGLDLHVVLRRSSRPDAVPLLLVHGWPQTFLEFERVLDALAEPDAPGDPAFHVVVPSLPGFGFSPSPGRLGVGLRTMANAFVRLMVEGLGHASFVVLGEDWGTTIGAAMALDHPERVRGLHVNLPSLAPDPSTLRDLDAEERAWLGEMKEWRRVEGAYWKVHQYKPRTLAFATADSPVALAAWILDRVAAWSDHDGRVDAHFGPDTLAELLTVYWVTQSAFSASRIYLEHGRAPVLLAPGQRVEVPTAIAAYPKEVARPPRRFVERCYRVTRFTVMPRGGHFPALEAPELVVGDLRAFARELAAT